MFVVFEGIDGSGKTTISNRVAKALRERGLSVEHLREEGAFASKVTQGIRDFCRDARNMALTPRAELMLYVAREVQLGDEVLRPALGRADVVIADRYFYTAEVLAQGRDLSREETDPVIAAAAGGLWPDIAFLIDVDPSVARGRRKVAKILSPDRRPVSRKGLTGSGLQLRLRVGYRALAERDPSRWILVENTDAHLEQVVATLVEAIASARTDRESAMKEARARLAAVRPPPRVVAPLVDGVRSALPAFLAWVDRRAISEPALAAYVLSGTAGHGIDERRVALSAVVPRIIGRGLRGLSDATSWQLRRQLLEIAPAEIAASLGDVAAETNEAWALRELLADVSPAEVAASLDGLDDETAWALRNELFARVPESVLGSLALLDVPRAWELRDRWIEVRGGLGRAASNYFRARALARSVTGIDGPEAWKLRKAVREVAPVAAVVSLKGLTGDKAWIWRERAVGRAPKAVLATIAGMDDARAWALRTGTALRCREALDSMIGLDQEAAWEIREACLEIWPPSVVKSLGVLVSGARGHDLVERALAGFADQISLLKQAAIIATGANLMRSVMAA
ncbi:MAG TPA: dTMP kinase [Polyangia bacterium]|jgi:dTMP kinase|nr:dTMP kinase [Polyangia bacterium]